MDPERSAAYLAWLQPHDLRGANLRYALLTLLHEEGRPCDIATLHRRLEALGLVVRGPDPGKRIADVLRYECTKGRVVRVTRGRYRGLRRPDTTVRRHRDRLADLVAEGHRRAQRPPPPSR